jgi:hypothetical protein
VQVITSLPISTACGFCGNNARLAYVDPTGTNAVSAYGALTDTIMKS